MMQSLTIKRQTKAMQPYLYHHIFWVLLPLPEYFQEPYKKKKKTQEGKTACSVMS